MIDLLLDRLRSLTSQSPKALDFGFSPALQAQLDAIPDIVRDEDGDRDYPDSFYRPLRNPGVTKEEHDRLMNKLRCIKEPLRVNVDGEWRPVRGLEGIPLRKDLNPDRVTPSCSCCYYYFGNNSEPKCAINPTGDAATCEHFKPR